MDNRLILPRNRWPALLDAATCNRDRALLSMLLWVGLPVGRAVSLELNHVRFAAEELRAPDFSAYVHPHCLAELVAYLPERPEPRTSGNPLFVSERRGPLCSRQVHKIVHTAGAACGFPDLCPRSLRLSTAALLVERRASAQDIAEQLGYSEVRKAQDMLRRLGLKAVSVPNQDRAYIASLLRSC